MNKNDIKNTEIKLILIYICAIFSFILCVMLRFSVIIENCLKSIIITLLGLAAIVFGSNLVVNNSVLVAQKLGVSERLISLTIVAFGTSLPELVTSVVACIKKENDIAIGNIVGSNIFNILFVIGTTALICNVPFESKFLIDSAVAVAAGVILWLGTIKNKELRRPCGIIMLLAYAGYFAYLCMN